MRSAAEGQDVPLRGDEVRRVHDVRARVPEQNAKLPHVMRVAAQGNHHAVKHAPRVPRRIRVFVQVTISVVAIATSQRGSP